ncbi:MAG: hypothetical protein EOP84_31885 [Verrucomicrobiaceae bacterium]|nr:MAG: hypothetical protein EOP84_31885 [Verrucomicrobiaceae bacterium]
MSKGETSMPHEGKSVYLKVTLIMQATLVIGLTLFLLQRDWENVFLTVIVLGLTLIPALLWRKFRLYLPPEFQLVSVAFVFLSLFLGSARDFYYRFWWWDILLHTGSGFLLGIIGFIALYLLNQTNRLPRELSPPFRCFFGITFAVFLGVIWEIFEFACDQVWPYWNMQTTETGVADTMWDLIVDTIGAVIIGLMGYAYLKSGKYSFIGEGVRGFIQKNPRLFNRKSAASHGTRR